jgi:hypothetical protein
MAPGGTPQGLRVVECSVCHNLVDPNHPLQKELDASWAERDGKDQEAREREAERARKQPPASDALKGLTYGPAGAMTEERVVLLERRVIELERQVAALLAAVPKARLK